jgi:3-hydroxyacyl-CoA dehydrogenase/enoyl-CoA hydratase/3-hydroxybutyryl-CoA epimerase
MAKRLLAEIRPGQRGRALQFINAYGPAKFMERARELAKKYGPRFEPAGMVARLAAEGGRFAD